MLQGMLCDRSLGPDGSTWRYQPRSNPDCILEVIAVVHLLLLRRGSGPPPFWTWEGGLYLDFELKFALL